ncbi:ArdC-like ssDNA-binding domain-containing protein [Rubrivirga sp. IMCC45206]|uniref:ArdC-like ssDNA-binding domain-containing protein n=1 Tax=Rubrivirga sp. IMCC45206 TaxID=3391614 RepID=UPI00398F92DE
MNDVIIPTTTAGQLGFTFTAPADDRTPSQRRADQARARLAQGLDGIREDPAVLAGYLAFCAHFTDYSARNKLLVYLQNPRARHCKGYRDWTRHGRQVRKGERGLTILAPLLRKPTADEVAAGADPDRRIPYGFRAVAVFDYAQTDAVADDALVYAPPVSRLDADGPEGLVGAIEAAITAYGYAVETTDTGYADGRCRFEAKVVEVRAGLSSADRAAVLTHELAHAVAHGPDATDRPSRASVELQAEGAAFVGLAAMELDTGRCSLPYLKNWASGDDDALSAELAAIDRIAGLILDLVGATEGR